MRKPICWVLNCLSERHACTCFGQQEPKISHYCCLCSLPWQASEMQRRKVRVSRSLSLSYTMSILTRKPGPYAINANCTTKNAGGVRRRKGMEVTIRVHVYDRHCLLSMCAIEDLRKTTSAPFKTVFKKPSVSYWEFSIAPPMPTCMLSFKTKPAAPQRHQVIKPGRARCLDSSTGRNIHSIEPKQSGHGSYSAAIRGISRSYLSASPTQAIPMSSSHLPQDFTHHPQMHYL